MSMYSPSCGVRIVPTTYSTCCVKHDFVVVMFDYCNSDVFSVVVGDRIVVCSSCFTIVMRTIHTKDYCL